jgi:hypothetical protein
MSIFKRFPGRPEQARPTPDLPDEIARLLPEAEKQLKVFGDALAKPFDYSLDSLGRLERVLGEAWPEPPRNVSTLDMPVQLFGAYFGESLRRIYGGRWVTGDGLPYLQGLHHPDCKLFPFPVIYQKMMHRKPIEHWVVAYHVASRPDWKPT